MWRKGEGADPLTGPGLCDSIGSSHLQRQMCPRLHLARTCASSTSAPRPCLHLTVCTSPTPAPRCLHLPRAGTSPAPCGGLMLSLSLTIPSLLHQCRYFPEIGDGATDLGLSSGFGPIPPSRGRVGGPSLWACGLGDCRGILGSPSAPPCRSPGSETTHGGGGAFSPLPPAPRTLPLLSQVLPTLSLPPCCPWSPSAGLPSP